MKEDVAVRESNKRHTHREKERERVGEEKKRIRREVILWMKQICIVVEERKEQLMKLMKGSFFF